MIKKEELVPQESKRQLLPAKSEASLFKQIQQIDFELKQELDFADTLEVTFKMKYEKTIVELMKLYVEEMQLQQCQPLYLRKMVKNLCMMNYALLSQDYEPIEEQYNASLEQFMNPE